jgi:hypothetical protein
MSTRRLWARRPLVEELEGRVVPSVLGTSTNWSGYAVQAPQASVTSVVGTWKVPTVTGTGTTYSATWVGIDGWASSSVEQIGTEADVVNGRAVYSAWYEMYPLGSVDISMKVSPGDTVTAQVSYAAGKFSLQLTNGAQSFSISKTAAGVQRSSAEWIMEAPSSYSVLPLANFGTQSFSGARATISGTPGAIDSAAWKGAQVEQINMVSSYTGGTLDTTSKLTDSGSGAQAASSFTVTFSPASSPSPPPPTHHHGGGGWLPWWFQPEQPGTSQAALAASLAYAAPQGLAPVSISAVTPQGLATTPATLVSPILPSSALAGGRLGEGPAYNTAPSEAQPANEAVMPLVPADGPAAPRERVAPRLAPDAAPMPPAGPDEARGDLPRATAAWRRACDACFTDGGLAPAVRAEGAGAVIERPATAGSAVASVAAALFVLSLGGGTRTAGQTAPERRRWQIRR